MHTQAQILTPSLNHSASTRHSPIIDWIGKSERKTFRSLTAVFAGAGLIALLAQVAIPLPFSPVPVTGQTFGVYFVSLLWGRKLGVSAVASYLLLGFLDAPFFAFGRGGFFFGPTTGYLAGMLMASILVGWLADRGASKRWGTAYLSCVAGSALIFICGLTVLSQFVPQGELWMMGFLPFIPDDILKSGVAAYLVSRLVNSRNSRSLKNTR